MPVLTCSHCGAKNRVDEQRARTARPVCGRCGAPLSVPGREAGGNGGGKPIELTDQSLEGALESAGDKPVLVDAWAAWCGPCRMLAPAIEQLAAESNGRWIVGKIDIDQNPRTAERFSISSIPALLIFKNGRLVDRLVGLQPAQAIAARLRQYA